MSTIAVDYRTQDGYGILDDRVVFNTPVVGYSIGVPKIQLLHDGQLVISKGFVWDYASGAIDTPAMIYASLPHDAFWILRKQGKLPKKAFGVVDAYFRQCLEDAGEGWLRRWYAWSAVRLYSLRQP